MFQIIFTFRRAKCAWPRVYVCVSIVVSDVLEWEGEENFDDSARLYACTVSLDVIVRFFLSWSSRWCWAQGYVGVLMSSDDV